MFIYIVDYAISISVHKLSQKICEVYTLTYIDK